MNTIWNKMRKNKGCLLWLLLLLSQASLACTIFKLSDGQQVYVGNNEDWNDPFTRYWVVPGVGQEYGRVFFGYYNDWEQGGINEKGLFYDWVAEGGSKGWQSDPAKKNANRSLCDQLLAQCQSVSEGIELFRHYNERGFDYSTMMLADASGHTALIYWKDGQLRFEEIQTPFSVYGVKSQEVQAAFDLNASVSVQRMAQLLEAGHQAGKWPTQYSNIYDLKNKKVYLYHFHDYTKPHEIDLAEALTKGKQTVNLDTLFDNAAHQAYTKRYLRSQRWTPILKWGGILLFVIFVIWKVKRRN